MSISSVGILTAALFFILPFATSRHLFYAAVNTKYFLVVSAVLILALFAAHRLWKGGHSFSFTKRPLLWAGLSVLALYWLAAFLGEFPERSLYADIVRSTGVFFLTHLAVFSILLAGFFSEREWRVVRRSIALSSGLAGVLLLLGVEGFGIDARLGWTNLGIAGYTFGNTTFAGTYLLLAFSVALWELTTAERYTKWFGWITASALAIFFSPILFNAGILWGKTPLSDLLSNPILLLGSARASSAAAILLVVFYGGYLLLRRYGGVYATRALLAWAVVILLTIATGLALLFTPGSFVQERYIEASTGARILVWEGGFEAFKERPLFGWGTENFQRAYQSHFDNRLFEEEYLGETWFDRAHNIIIDTLVDVGAAGFAGVIAVVAMFIWVVYRAWRQTLLGEREAVLLLALPVAHFLQLQTGFDTVGSYTLLAFLGGYGLWLERRIVPHEQKKPQRSREGLNYYRAGAVVLVLLALASAKLLLWDEFVRQNALYKTFVEKDSAKQLQYVEVATARLSSFESTRFATGSLLKGMTETVAAGQFTAQTLANNLPQLELFESRYRRYIEVQPDYYRAYVGLAYLLSTQSAFGQNKLKEAEEVIEQAYSFSPQNPLTPGLHALIELYLGNVGEARAKAQEALALNPEAPFSIRIVDHIERQASRLPNISILRLENL